ncbi:MAG: ferritin family protein [Armatimonadetes bacterium]|nr:ferritin family protein [Armatimonadota bacterium]
MAEAGVFSSREMVEMAIQTEQNGYAFYTEAASKARADSVRSLLEWLAGQEKQHEEVFRGMLDKPELHIPAEEYPGQREAFVQALLESRVLPDRETGLRSLQRMTEDDQIIQFALGFEKDTILFMLEMRDLVAPAGRDTVNKLIAEEKGHMRRLLDLRKELGLA